MRAAERADAGEVDAGAARAPSSISCSTPSSAKTPVSTGAADGDALHGERPRRGRRRWRATARRRRRSRRCRRRRDAAKTRDLMRGIVLERAVAVEMVGRDVEQRRGVGLRARREVDLERGELEHIGEVGRRTARDRARPCRYCRRAPRACPPLASRWAVSAVVVDLPLVPVMTTTLPGALLLAPARGRTARYRRSPRCPRLARCSTVQCGSGWVSGMPGASTSAAKRDQSALARSLHGEALATRPPRARPACRPRRIGLAPPAFKRARGGEAAQAQGRRPQHPGRRRS